MDVEQALARVDSTAPTAVPRTTAEHVLAAEVRTLRAHVAELKSALATHARLVAELMTERDAPGWPTQPTIPTRNL